MPPAGERRRLTASPNGAAQPSTPDRFESEASFPLTGINIVASEDDLWAICISEALEEKQGGFDDNPDVVP